MTFSNQLRHRMNEKEVTQKQLSDLTGIGKSSISQYISGKNEPSEKNKQKLMDALDIPVSYCSLESNEKVYDDKIGNVPISVAAKKMGKSEQFIRVGLQRGVFDFGYAVKMSSKFTYHISPKKFYDYLGLNPD